MANEYLTGGIGGAATGASTGFAIGGPTGAGIGAGLGLIGGLLQAGQQKNRMDAYGKAEAAVQPVDPNQVAFLNRLKRQEQFYRAGTDSASAFARQDQGNALAQTQANITRMGGGINQLLRSQQMGNMGYAAIGAQASRMADPMLMAQGNLTNMIAQRQYEYQQRNRDVAMGRMEQGRQDLMNLFAGGIASVPSFAKAAPGVQQPNFGRNTDPFRIGYNPNFVSQQPPSQQYRSSQNFGFSPPPASPNYGFNYEQPRPNFGLY